MEIPQCACESLNDVFGTAYVGDGSGNMILLDGTDIRNIKSLIIQDGVTNIGERVFSGFSGLTSMTFKGNAPRTGSNPFYGVSPDCVVYVQFGSTGWSVDIPGVWNGLPIRYQDCFVTFNLGEHCVSIGGDDLERIVECLSAAVAPEVTANEGWEFIGWDSDLSCVVSNMVVHALCRRVYTPSEAVVAGAQSASRLWTVGTNGVATVKGYDDMTTSVGKSVKFTAVDDSSVWMETVVTNTCQVSFDWKSSCEPLVKGFPYDYISFAVDGVQVAFLCDETEWMNMAVWVTGEGEHYLRWTFTRDEEGSSGEDCAWLTNVTIGEIPPVAFGEYLNWPEQTFTTGGDAGWMRVKGVSADGYALRSGAITHSQTSRLETVVSGPGTVSFMWKASCEDYFVFRTQKILCDHLLFLVDGEPQGLVNGETDWTNATFTVEGAGEHQLTWTYVKDSEESEGEDCAWLDMVTWTPGVESRLAAWLAERNLTADARVANGRTAAECYVLGLDPADATNDFRIVSIEFVDGKPKVEWEPKVNRWTGTAIQAVLKGAESLAGEWHEVDKAIESDKEKFRFFKVVVEVP